MSQPFATPQKQKLKPNIKGVDVYLAELIIVSKSPECVPLAFPRPVVTRFREYALAGFQPVISRASAVHRAKYKSLEAVRAPGTKVKSFTASASGGGRADLQGWRTGTSQNTISGHTADPCRRPYHSNSAPLFPVENIEVV